MSTSSDGNGKALPPWANEASIEELCDIIDQFDHNVEASVGVRGWVCAIPGCEAQVQMYESNWWHVPELIAYSIVSGQVEQEDPPGYAMAVAAMQNEQEREAKIIVMGPRNREPAMATVTRDGLTTQERIDQTIALWEATQPGGYEAWGD